MPGCLTGAVGVACSQSWLPVAGLVAGCYRGGADILHIAWPMWAGSALGVLSVFAWRLARGRERGAVRRGPALCAALVGLMLLVAARAGGTFVGSPASLWRAAAAFGSALSSAGGAFLTCAWLDSGALGSEGRGWQVAGGACSALALSLLLAAVSAMGGSAWVPFAVGVLVAVSYLLLEACGGSAQDGGGSSPRHGAAPGPAAAQATGRQGAPAGGYGRLCLAGAMLGLAVGLMGGQFIGCQHGVASPYTWAFGPAGVALAVLAQLALRRLRGGWDPLVACWACAALFVVAFYPMDAGSEFSLRFAVSMTTFAVWATAAALPAACAEFARAKGLDAAPCWLVLSIGIVGAGAVAGPAGYAVAFTPIQGVFVLVSAVCSMVTVIAALTLVLYAPLSFAPRRGGCSGSGVVGREASAEASGLPSQEGAGARAPLADGAQAEAGGQGVPVDGVRAACARLASSCGLTPRELDALVVLARGYDVARVQEDLGVSEGTALTHKRHIYQKLDVHTRSELLDRVHQA